MITSFEEVSVRTGLKSCHKYLLQVERRQCSEQTYSNRMCGFTFSSFILKNVFVIHKEQEFCCYSKNQPWVTHYQYSCCFNLQRLFQAKAWKNYTYGGLEVWDSKRKSIVLECICCINVCVCMCEILCIVLCGREGGGRPSVTSISVVLTLVFIAYCTCSTRTIASRLPKWRHQSQNDNITSNWWNPGSTSLIWVVKLDQMKECVVLECLAERPGWLFSKSRLKIRTGRARFRETGRLMQGNGLRH